MRDSDDNFMRAQALEEELDTVQREKKAMQLQILRYESSTLELQFDNDLKGQECDRLRRRVRELESANDVLAAGKAPRGTESGGKRAAGERFKRERDLEGVVEGLQKVVAQLKKENERLRSGGGGDIAKLSAAERRAREAKQEVNRLKDEVTSLRTRAHTADDAMSKLATRNEQVGQLKRSVRQRDDELHAANRKAKEAMSKVSYLEDECKQARERVSALERQLDRVREQERPSTTSQESRAVPHVSPGGEAEIRDLKNQIRILKQRQTSENTGGGASQREVADLQTQLEASRREIRRLETRLSRGAAPSSGSGGADVMELTRLRTENAKLREELSAFDIEFFDEIEDLKYKYAEAVKKLQEYEDSGY